MNYEGVHVGGHTETCTREFVLLLFYVIYESVV